MSKQCSLSIISISLSLIKHDQRNSFNIVINLTNIAFDSSQTFSLTRVKVLLTLKSEDLFRNYPHFSHLPFHLQPFLSTLKLFFEDVAVSDFIGLHRHNHNNQSTLFPIAVTWLLISQLNSFISYYLRHLTLRAPLNSLYWKRYFRNFQMQYNIIALLYH